MLRRSPQSVRTTPNGVNVLFSRQSGAKVTSTPHARSASANVPGPGNTTETEHRSRGRCARRSTRLRCAPPTNAATVSATSTRTGEDSLEPVPFFPGEKSVTFALLVVAGRVRGLEHGERGVPLFGRKAPGRAALGPALLETTGKPQSTSPFAPSLDAHHAITRTETVQGPAGCSEEFLFLFPPCLSQNRGRRKKGRHDHSEGSPSPWPRGGPKRRKCARRNRQLLTVLSKDSPV